MITVRLRTFGFFAVVLVGLFCSSCAVTPRRAAVSGLASAGAAELNHAGHHPPGEMRASFASADASVIYHYSFDRQHVS